VGGSDTGCWSKAHICQRVWGEGDCLGESPSMGKVAVRGLSDGEQCLVRQPKASPKDLLMCPLEILLMRFFSKGSSSL